MWSVMQSTLGSLAEQIARFIPGLFKRLQSQLLTQLPQPPQFMTKIVPYQRLDKTTRDNLICLIKENAAFKLRHGKTREAVDMLEKLRREDPSDTRTLARIITAYSQINPKKAEEYSKELPEFAEEGVDAEALERQHLTGSIRFSKKFQKSDADEIQGNREEIITKKKKRKKKKGKLPKNYNPEVDPDPERWLPKWERSTFKHKKQKRGQMGKGASQGSVGVDTPASPSAPKGAPAPTTATGGAAASPTPSSPSPGANVVPPRQQKPQGAKAKPKKKKKGGW